MKYFKGVSEIGDLQLNQVLFEFDKTPILFVCKDEEKRDYLCLCTDMIIEETWMITQISCRGLIDLIEDKISILEAYQRSENEIILAKRQGKAMTYKKYSFALLPEDELPDEKEKLENPRLTRYLEELYQREREAVETSMVMVGIDGGTEEQYKKGQPRIRKLQLPVEAFHISWGNTSWKTENQRMLLSGEPVVFYGLEKTYLANYSVGEIMRCQMQISG